MKQYLESNFPQLTKDQALLKELVEQGEIRSFAAGETIIDYGSYIRFVPLVLDGIIKVVRENEEGKEVLLYFLNDGDTCAATFSCCLVRKRSEVKAIAEDNAMVLMIPLESADRWMGRYTVWRNFVMDMYDERLFALIDTIDKLAFASLDEKLWDYLENRTLLGQANTIEISHQEIASDLNVSREAVSRLLKKLEKMNRITLGRNRITVPGKISS